MIGDFFRRIWDGAAFVASHLNPFNSVVREPNAEERARLAESITTRSGLHLGSAPEGKHHNVSARKALADAGIRSSKSASAKPATPHPVRDVIAPMKHTSPSSISESAKKTPVRVSPAKSGRRAASKSLERPHKVLKTPTATVASRTRSRSRPPSVQPEPVKSVKKSKKTTSGGKVKSSDGKKGGVNKHRRPRSTGAEKSAGKGVAKKRSASKVKGSSAKRPSRSPSGHLKIAKQSQK